MPPSAVLGSSAGTWVHPSLRLQIRCCYWPPIEPVWERIAAEDCCTARPLAGDKWMEESAKDVFVNLLLHINDDHGTRIKNYLGRN